MDSNNLRNPYLTSTEQKTIQMLADGKSYEEIKDMTGLTTLELCPFLAGIRRKTGIKDTKKSVQARAYLLDYAKAANGPGPTEEQMEVLMRSAGVGFVEHSLLAVGNRMGIGDARAVILYEEGLRAAGIFGATARERRVQLRMFLASRTVIKDGVSALTDNHLAVLGLYAQGYNTPMISKSLGEDDFKEEYVEMLIEEGAMRLGVTARGRGVQRKLVAIALERVKQERAPVTPDDPMF